jgi:hemerythrin superfamily protein
MTRTRNKGQVFAIMTAGIAAGVLGSRLLPPLMALATGAARARRTDDPFDLLIADHRKIESLLDRMVAEPSGATAKRASLFLMLKRKLGKHALAEEDVVYPILHADGVSSAQSKELYDEHADMKILLFEIEEILMRGGDWTEPVTCLRALVMSHIHEEELDVFPRLRQQLDTTGKSKVSGQISREEALIL